MIKYNVHMHREVLNMNLNVEYLDKKPRARVVFFSTLVEPHSIKEITETWYQPKNWSREGPNVTNVRKPQYPNPLYQGGLVRKCLMYGLLYIEGKGKGNEILLRANPDAFIEWLDNAIKLEWGNSDIKQHSEDIKKYLESPFVKEYFSLSNLKAYFTQNNKTIAPVLLFERKDIIPVMLFAFPMVIKKLRPLILEAEKKDPKRLKRIEGQIDNLFLLVLGLSGNISIKKLYEVVKKNIENIPTIPNITIVQLVMNNLTPFIEMYSKNK